MSKYKFEKLRIMGMLAKGSQKAAHYMSLLFLPRDIKPLFFATIDQELTTVAPKLVKQTLANYPEGVSLF